MKHAALLRGINVGGKNMLPMKDLAELFGKAGCRDVVTYIQSGNVVFEAPAATLKKLPQTISQKIADQFGHSVPVVIRSHDELAAVIGDNPFLKAGEPEKTLHIAFLANTPAAEAIAKLDPHRSPPDRFTVAGNHVYLHLPNGMGNTKITNAWLDSRLSTVSTARNWATVLKLHEMTKTVREAPRSEKKTVREAPRSETKTVREAPRSETKTVREAPRSEKRTGREAPRGGTKK